LLQQELGEEDFNSVKSSDLSSLSGSFKNLACSALGRGVMVGLYRQILLSISSQLWVDYLTSMEALRTSVGLEAYAQRDPLTAYKSRAFDLFRQLLIDMRSSLVSRMFTSTPIELTGVNTQTIVEESEVDTKVLRRNDQCWCGSGKKFKNCHMNKTNRSGNKPQQRANAARAETK
jgi:preprotein translocase subunit SecA